MQQKHVDEFGFEAQQGLFYGIEDMFSAEIIPPLLAAWYLRQLDLAEAY